MYSTDEQNDWHYMVITWNNATDTFDWRNRAGYHWSLTPIQKGDEDWDTTKLKVGPECPYFENGHEFAAVEWEGEPGYSVVSTIKGPWGEAFLREESCGPVNPFKTPMGAPPGPKSSPSTKSGVTLSFRPNFIKMCIPGKRKLVPSGWHILFFIKLDYGKGINYG